MEVERREIFLQNLQNPFCLLHMSDLHFDCGDGKYLQELEPVIKDLSFDMLTIGGDLIHREEGIPYLKEMFSMIPRHVKTFAVFGNHDYEYYSFLRGYLSLLFRSGRNKPQSIDTERIRKTCREAKITFLENQDCSAEICGNRFYFYGLKPRGYWSGHPVPPRPPESTAGTPLTRLLLTHYPDLPPALLGEWDLMLGGHTHGAQVIPKSTGPLRSNCRLTPDCSKGHFKSGNCQWLVNNGFNSDKKLRVRLNCPRQISLIQLKPGKPPDNLPELKYEHNCTPLSWLRRKRET